MNHMKNGEPAQNADYSAAPVQLVYGPPAMLNGNAPEAVPNPVQIRAYRADDLPEMTAVWNGVVAAGNAFPQEELLNAEDAAAFFAQQTYCGVAELNGMICGLYILHPNNVGRCGHISNAS